ncbi:unnamed protein product [Urochloa humidicola]
MVFEARRRRQQPGRGGGGSGLQDAGRRGHWLAGAWRRRLQPAGVRRDDGDGGSGRHRAQRRAGLQTTCRAWRWPARASPTGDSGGAAPPPPPPTPPGLAPPPPRLAASGAHRRRPARWRGLFLLPRALLEPGVQEVLLHGGGHWSVCCLTGGSGSASRWWPLICVAATTAATHGRVAMSSNV